ncbi:MAG TPA: PhnA domain protein [Hellea balneolensis]|uniref:PhnA domain protein n=1 Tax=Hellea balneolensis TaxID=287478 RepID=A0A7C5M0C6_9PROT|nr:PhnA domain protein [Hellea balneolensis]
MTDTHCALCQATENLSDYDVPNSPSPTTLSLCETCQTGIQNLDPSDTHWQILSETMWSENPAVQVMASRLLKALNSQSWAQDALDMLYLDDETKSWADAGSFEPDDTTPTLDSNGTRLNNGDSVILIKDLAVKGAGFTAKRGTAVRNISLTTNPEHIEGRVNGQQIVLVSAYLKKSG